MTILNSKDFNNKIDSFQDQIRMTSNKEMPEYEISSAIELIKKEKDEFIKQHFESLGWSKILMDVTDYSGHSKNTIEFYSPIKNLFIEFSYDGGRYNAYFNSVSLIETMFHDDDSVYLKKESPEKMTFYSYDDEGKENSPVDIEINSDDFNGLETLSFWVERNFFYIYINGYIVCKSFNPSNDFNVSSKQ